MDPRAQFPVIAVLELEQKLPAGQGWQTTLEVGMQAVCVNCPEIQVLQVVHDGALEEVEYDVPATHAAHTVFDVALHALAILIPAAQEEQLARVAGVVQK